MINILAMDKEFNIVGVLAYDLLQWRRRYFEAGSFSIDIPISQYNNSIKYIYTKDREEIGKVTQINYNIDARGQRVSLSGYFMEQEFNRRVVFPRATEWASNSNIAYPNPTWLYVEGKAETVATQYAQTFKDVQIYTGGQQRKRCNLGIDVNASPTPRGKQSVHYRNGEYLGNKLYNILKPSLLSYRVTYAGDDLTKAGVNLFVMNVIQGVDHTAEGENPVVFSTKYGNINNIDLLIDTTETKNAVITVSDEDEEKDVFTWATVEAETEENVNFIKLDSMEKKKDYATIADFAQVLTQEAHEELLEHRDIISFDFNAIAESYAYRADFDLGDVVQIVIDELNIDTKAVLTGVNEIIKAGAETIELQFETLEEVTA